MTKRTLFLPVLVLLPVFEDEDDPPPSYDADATAEELSTVRPALAKCAPLLTERKAAGK